MSTPGGWEQRKTTQFQIQIPRLGQGLTELHIQGLTGIHKAKNLNSIIN